MHKSKILYSFIVALTLFSLQDSWAQSFKDKLTRIEFMVGGEFLKLDEKMIFNGQQTPGRGHKESVSTFNFGAALNIPIIEITENLSIGLASGFSMAFIRDDAASSFDMDQDGAYLTEEEKKNPSGDLGLINIPIIATIKYGGEASLESTKLYGAGIGIGYNRSMLYVANATYHLPIIVGELTFGNKGILKLRGTLPLTSYQPNENLTISQYSFSVGVIGLIGLL